MSSEEKCIPDICPKCGEEGKLARVQSAIFSQCICNVKKRTSNYTVNGEPRTSTYYDYDWSDDFEMLPKGPIDRFECIACGAQFDTIEELGEALEKQMENNPNTEEKEDE